MSTSIFYVKIRENYKKDRMDYFPYISREYINIAKNFKADTQYPVLSVKDVTIIATDDTNVETSQFLVPTENKNFMWVQSEIFQFAGTELDSTE